MTDIVERLRSHAQNLGGKPEDYLTWQAADEIERLLADNADLRRWKALDKPLTAAMAIANSHNAPLRAEIERLKAERDKYKGTLRFLAGEGITAARNALEDKQ